MDYFNSTKNKLKSGYESSRERKKFSYIEEDSRKENNDKLCNSICLENNKPVAKRLES